MDLKTLEDVGTFMLVNIRLSRYDLQFINNLTNLIIRNNTITSNQDSLFRKIAFKYRKQFIQHKMFVDDLLLLPWNCNMVESSPQYTNASISVLKDKIIFKSPFSKSFLTALKGIPSILWNGKKTKDNIKFNMDLRH